MCIMNAENQVLEYDFDYEPVLIELYKSLINTAYDIPVSGIEYKNGEFFYKDKYFVILEELDVQYYFNKNLVFEIDHKIIKKDNVNYYVYIQNR